MCDVIAGICSGIAQMIVGHPLDTVKVLIQNGQSYHLPKWHMYYRGATYPLISSIIFNGTVFPVYERTLNHTQSTYISGLCSGIVVSPIMFIFDVGKIKRQMNQSLHIRDFIQTKGLPITFLRESFAMTIYFSSYNYFRKYTNAFTAGGLAGLTNWTITYPLDILRSRQIAQNITIQEALVQRKLWNGYLPCALRAVLVNGACFYVYEKVMKLCSFR